MSGTDKHCDFVTTKPLYQHSEKFDLIQKFSTWFYTIATSLVKNRFRYRSSRPQVSLGTTGKSEAGLNEIILDEKVSTPSENMQADERTEAVRKKHR